MNSITRNTWSLWVLLVGTLMMTSFRSIHAANEATIVGKWMLITSDEYNEASSEKESEEKPQGVVWEFTEQKVIVHDKNDELDGIALGYTFKNRVLTIDKISITFKADEITDSKLVLRSSPLGGRYTIFTFKKVK